MSKNNSGVTTPAAVLIAGLMISVALFMGLKGGLGNSPAPLAAVPTTAPQQPPQQPPQPTTGTASLDDDAVLGDRTTAKVAIIEFSDYECPFCERFYSATLPDIKKNYIDTGKAVFVFRDYPLSFHEPAATREAIAAQCGLKLGKDAGYFKIHDAIFKTTKGNGAGITEDELVKLATAAGLNGTAFRSCLTSDEYKNEVASDMSDGQKAGVNGTPGFIVGTLSADGTVTGDLISGAMPYDTFRTALDKFLAQ